MYAWQLLAVLGAGALLGLLLVALVRMPVGRISRPLLGFLVCAGLWAVGDTLATSAREPVQKNLGLVLLYTGSIYLPPIWWLAALRWARERGCRLPMRRRAWTLAPLAWATLMWAAMITNPWHGLFLTPVVGGRNLYGPLWWAMAVPNYLLIVAVLGVEIQVVRHVRRREVRRQSAFLIAASLTTLIANAAYVAGFSAPHGTLVVLTLASTLLLAGMVREGVFGVLPVALRVLAEDDPDGLVVLRPDGRVAYRNARARSLLSPSALAIGARLPGALAAASLQPDDTRPDAPAPGSEPWWERLGRPGGALYRVGTGEPRWLRIHARPVLGRRGELRARCLRIGDVTAERQAEVELRRARRLESVAELALGIAHDFQNVLAIVRGNADLLLADAPSGRSLERKAGRILDAVERASELASQLQLYAGGAEPERALLDLAAELRELVDLVREDFPGTRLDLRGAERRLPVLADATQIRQVLLNLLVNAQEALPETGGRITASAGSCWLDPAHAANLVEGRDRPAGEYAFVRIADNGAGMDAATQERLFEPYFSTKGKHRGVGLSTTLGIVRAHGALLELETEQGRGSVFALYLALEGEAA